MTSEPVSDVSELQRSLAGDAIVPGDAGYDEARRIFNAMIDRRPAVIARCVGPGDVATAFDFARVHELDVAVRGGGHHPAGHAMCDGGIVIDLSAMRGVDVDRDSWVAHAQGGATWLDFDSATQDVGLVSPGGVVGSTGVCGLAMGGGIGHLTAQHGLTCDNLVGAELVAPDGDVIQANEHDNAELLWGIRGGGGNFGVATRLDFRLGPLQRVVGGLLEYRGSAVGDVLRTFRDIVTASPRDLSCQAVLSVDESRTPALVVAPCYTGSRSDPEPIRSLRSQQGLVSDDVRARTFLEQQLVFDSAYGQNRHYWKGQFVRELAEELIDELIRRLVALGRPPVHVLIESLHGAPKDADGTIGPIAYRTAAFNVSIMAVWENAEDDQSHIAWARETTSVLDPWSLGAAYANYMQADESFDRMRASFGEEAFDRLQRLKGRYDPANVLQRNQNIPPGNSDERGAGRPRRS
jgi:FAD/FMN-containing dehydrogenase